MATINGTSGNNTISGGAGNDNITGGGGNDTYLFGKGDGKDTLVSEDLDGLNETNTLFFKSNVTVSEVAATRFNNNLQLAIIGTSDSMTVLNFFYSNDPFNRYNPLQQVKFSDGTTWTGIDILVNGFGGSSANDTLDGTNYADKMIGGLGNDSLTGGGGNDTYLFGKGDGKDVLVSEDLYGLNETNTLLFKPDVTVSEVAAARLNNNLRCVIAGTTDSITVQNFFYGNDPYNRYNPLQEMKFSDGTVWDIDAITNLAFSGIPTTTNHPPVGNVTISDTTPEQNQILTVSNSLTDADGLGTISYQWKAAGVNIGTGDSYTVTANEVGKPIQVTASYIDNLANPESVSSLPTSVVTAPIDAGFTINPTTEQTTSENGTTANYSIRLNTAPIINQDVVLTFTSSDTGEGVIDNPTLTFTSTNYATTQTLTVRGVDDYLDDGAVPYQVTAKISTLDVFYKALTINPFNLTNADDGLDKALDLYGDEGGSKIDVLNGGNGADKLHGLNKADNLSGGLGNDSLWGGYGDDNLFGNEGDDKLFGEQENDYLDGGAGNDTLDGGDGVDTMIGGAGNDTYYLGYDAIDVIKDDGLATDIDTVIMPYQLTSYTLPKGIEKGTIAAGSQASNLTGNTSNNALTGNDGSNMLIGAVGRDSLFGGAGNDVLLGGTGNDLLNGGMGKDTFKFDTALTANTDKITDFSVVDDIIQLENAIFTKLTTAGVLDAGVFVKGTAAQDANDYIIYNTATGTLTYDADGNGTNIGVKIAVLGVNLALTNADFVVI